MHSAVVTLTAYKNTPVEQRSNVPTFCTCCFLALGMCCHIQRQRAACNSHWNHFWSWSVLPSFVCLFDFSLLKYTVMSSQGGSIAEVWMLFIQAPMPHPNQSWLFGAGMRSMPPGGHLRYPWAVSPAMILLWTGMSFTLGWSCIMWLAGWNQTPSTCLQ